MVWNRRGKNAIFGANFPDDERDFKLQLSAEEGLLDVASLDEPPSEILKDLVVRVTDALGVEHGEILELFDNTFLIRVYRRLDYGSLIGLSVGQSVEGMEVGRDSYAGYALDNEGRSLIYQVDDRGHPFVIRNLEERRFDLPPHLENGAVRCGIAVPIEVHGRPWGVLAVHHNETLHLSKVEYLYLGKATALAGVAVSRDLRLEELRTSWDAAERRLRIGVEACRVVGMTVETRQAAQAVAQLAVRDIADWCWVDLVKEDDPSVIERVAIVHSDDEPSAARLAAKVSNLHKFDPNAAHGTSLVLRTGRPEIVEEVDGRSGASYLRGDEHLETVKRLKGRSYICLPLQAGRNRVGSICFLTTTRERRLGTKDLEGTEALAAALALRLTSGQPPRTSGPAEESQQPQRATQSQLPLTPRQRDVLNCLAKGMNRKRTAEFLRTSESSVGNHITSLNRILGTRSSYQIVGRARELGILSDNEEE